MSRALYLGGTQSHLVPQIPTRGQLLNGYLDSTVLAKRFRLSYVCCCYACSLGGYISHVQCADDLLSSGSSAPGEPTLAPQIQPLLDHTLALDKSLGRSKSGKDREHPEGRSLE